MGFRQVEQAELAEFLASPKAEFLAIYGRRRIGKTFLVREFFNNKPVIFFNVTGIKDGTIQEQLKHFMKALGDVFYHGLALKLPKTWNEALEVLTDAIKKLPENQKVVLFFDEFPWMSTNKSKLLQNLSYYWNQYWEQNSKIKLIICGSSASWIINKVIKDRGGLHNRITRKMILDPLNLAETKLFLESQGIKLNNSQVLQIYLAIGGVPYYLSQVKRGLSAAQNIENLAFTRKAFLAEEFDNLFASLFKNHELNVEMIRLIANHPYGVGQEELFQKVSGNIKGKLGLAKLQELEEAGFIMKFMSFQNKRKGIFYKVIDEYTLFYLRWIEPVKNTLSKNSLPSGYWAGQHRSPAWYSWAGLAFETICYKHIAQIRKALKLNSASIAYTWRYQPTKLSESKGAQIDLLFDRNDGAITLCEIKFTETPFVIDKAGAKNLINKREVFVAKTKTQKQIFFSFISAAGVKETMYSTELVDSMATLDDLFQTAS